MLFALFALLAPLGLGALTSPDEFDLPDGPVDGWRAIAITSAFIAVPLWLGFALGYAGH